MKLVFLGLGALASLALLLPTSGARVLIGSTPAWLPIKNITDAHITDLAEFAVKSIDETAKYNLTFVKVVKGEELVTEGIDYRLKLEVKNGNGETKHYMTVVWEKIWKGFRQLTSFNPDD